MRSLATASAFAVGAVLLPASPALAQAPSSARTSVAVAAAQPVAGVAAATRPWKAPWSGTLRRGAEGPQVRAAQLRLVALGYWLDGVDGQYGSQTAQAVLALQKTAGLRRTATINKETTVALMRGIRPQARSKQGSLFEVDLKRQVLFVVVKGRTAWAINTSTGSNTYYEQDGVRKFARTPRGRFAINRQIDGERVAPLGVLFRPKYFYGGYAIHGSGSIPAYPASHGCVRVSNAAINWMWSSGVAPIGRRIWVY
ncbi:MAG TPA: L,D-transpeptidase family protein [Actinomycetales bacterium]